MNTKTLFHRGLCKSNSKTKIEVLAGRAGAIKPKQIQLNVVKEDNNSFVNIELCNITCLGNVQLASCGENSKLNTSYFNKLRDVDFKIFGSSQKLGLIFEFNNPLPSDVLVYITVLGDAADTSLIGRE